MHSLNNTASCTVSGLLAKLKLVQCAEGFAQECFIPPDVTEACFHNVTLHEKGVAVKDVAI